MSRARQRCRWLPPARASRSTPPLPAQWPRRGRDTEHDRETRCRSRSHRGARRYSAGDHCNHRSDEKQQASAARSCVLRQHDSRRRVVLSKYAACCVTCAFVGPVVNDRLALYRRARRCDPDLHRVSRSCSVSRPRACTGSGAAWTETLAQAATIGIVVVLGSWALDTVRGFCRTRLARSRRTMVDHDTPDTIRARDFRDWLVHLGCVSLRRRFVAHSVGARFDLARSRRGLLALAACVATVVLLIASGRIHRAYDMTETLRPSRCGCGAVRELHEPIRLDVYMDRDDSRPAATSSPTRSAKLRLARSDHKCARRPRSANRGRTRQGLRFSIVVGGLSREDALGEPARSSR